LTKKGAKRIQKGGEERDQVLARRWPILKTQGTVKVRVSFRRILRSLHAPKKKNCEVQVYYRERKGNTTNPGRERGSIKEVSGGKGGKCARVAGAKGRGACWGTSFEK